MAAHAAYTLHGVHAAVILKFLFPSRSRHKARAGIGFLPCTSFAEKQTLKQHRTARPAQFLRLRISISQGNR